MLDVGGSISYCDSVLNRTMEEEIDFFFTAFFLLVPL